MVMAVEVHCCLTVQSVLQDTQVSPSGAKEMPFTAAVWPSSRLRVRLAGMSQIRMSPSAVPDSKLLRALGFLAKQVMPSACVRLAMKGLAKMRSSLAAFRARVYSWAFCNTRGCGQEVTTQQLVCAMGATLNSFVW